MAKNLLIVALIFLGIWLLRKMFPAGRKPLSGTAKGPEELPSHNNAYGIIIDAGEGGFDIPSGKCHPSFRVNDAHTRGGRSYRYQIRLAGSRDERHQNRGKS